MSHKEIQMLISSYVDGEISGDEELLVLQHLNVCPECRQFIKNAGEIREEIRALGEIELSYAFSERVAHLVKQSDEKAQDWLGIEPLARNTFIVIAATVFMMFLFTSFNKSTSPGIAEVLIDGSNGDSAVTQVLLQPGKFSKSDLLYAVMAK
jgi:anti-sigma factor RsiW